MGRPAEPTRVNPPGTAETPENASGGVLIVALPGMGPERPPEPEGVDPESWTEMLERPRGLITATQVDRGPYVRRALAWLSSAGFDVNAASRHFAVMTWPGPSEDVCQDSSAHNASWRRMVPPEAKGARLPRWLAANAQGFLEVSARRRPKLVVFLSGAMLEATESPELASSVTDIYGPPQTPPCRLTDTRLAVWAQRRREALFLALPVSAAQATPAFEAALTEGLGRLLRTMAPASTAGADTRPRTHLVRGEHAHEG